MLDLKTFDLKGKAPQSRDPRRKPMGHESEKAARSMLVRTCICDSIVKVSTGHDHQTGEGDKWKLVSRPPEQ